MDEDPEEKIEATEPKVAQNPDHNKPGHLLTLDHNAALNYINFLRTHGGKIKLAVRTTTLAIQKLEFLRNGIEEGYLRIGEGDILQAVIGKHTFAVAEHPGCFELIAESHAVFRSTVHAAALAAVEENRRPIPLSPAVFAALTARDNIEKKRKIKERQFMQLLKSAVRIHSTLWDDNRGLTIMTISREPIRKIYELAVQMGFKPQTMIVRKLGIGICDVMCGNGFGKLLNQTLENAEQTAKATKLKDKDEHSVGAYAIIFPADREMLYILNKQAFMNECAWG